MAKYVGRVVDGVLLWFESPRRLDQQKQDPHSSCGSCNKKYKQKKGKKYCTRRCKETAHKIRNKVKKKGPSSSETRGVKKALEEVLASPLGQALSSIKQAPVVAAPDEEPVRGVTTRACKKCNKEFTPSTRGGQLFCTVKCRTKALNDRNYIKRAARCREVREQPRECLHCRKSFQVGPNGPLPKFCSAACRVEHNTNKKTTTEKSLPNKTFVERVAEHLPAPILPVVEPVKDQPASKVVVPTWTALVEEAKELGVSLDKEPRKSQSFYIALLMARRAHHYKEWKELLSTQDCRIRQLPETFSALKSVSGTSAFAAAKALKVSMNM
jgi:hypothetical protein